MNHKYTHWFLSSLLITLAILCSACGNGQIPDDPAFLSPIPETANFNCAADKNNEKVMLCHIREDIEVRIPFQERSESFLYAVNLPKDGDLRTLKEEKRDEFAPHRLVINFEIVVDQKEPDNYVSEFSPPINLRVPYTVADVKAVGGLKNLQLGFWDEVNNYWVSFNQNPKYEFSIEGDENGGFVTVIIPTWGDRHVGYGG